MNGSRSMPIVLDCPVLKRKPGYFSSVRNLESKTRVGIGFAGLQQAGAQVRREQPQRQKRGMSLPQMQHASKNTP
uniref:Uncharacterized protein n=1 Tax=Arundo donax TaxID=35708 RepID=A0A0A9FB46_ARUDO